MGRIFSVWIFKFPLAIVTSIKIVCANDTETVKKIMKDLMENIYPNLGVKLKVDISVGKNWGEL